MDNILLIDKFKDKIAWQSFKI